MVITTLGLDASTKCIGWALSQQKKIVAAGFFDTSKLEKHKKKAFAFIDFLENHPFFVPFDAINIEDNLSGFAQGKTTQQTIIKLAKWNAVFCYILEEKYGLEVKHLNPATARKRVFGCSRITGMKPKEFVAAEIPKIVPNLKDFEVLNKRGNPDKKMADMYDAMVVSLCS